MRPALARLSMFCAVAAALVTSACAGSPFAPERTNALAKRPNVHADLVPCDSTIVVDGTCRAGYIIPW
jgi:hypothetical protein